MKHEWRKREKTLYLPKNQPELVEVPPLKFVSIKGAGNPNGDNFISYVEALFAISYTIKMSYKKGLEPAGFFDFTVYPLEGVWDLSKEGQEKYDGSFSKEDLVFKLMIRQPEFVDSSFFENMRELAMQKKSNPRLKECLLETIEEGPCVQMLHLGPYDDEPASFRRMEDFAKSQGLSRASMKHREIYLSDARKTSAEKLKTTLRFKVN